MVGKAAEKYFDETKGAKGGWKVHVVKAVDMERNRVYLEGVSVSPRRPWSAPHRTTHEPGLVPC
jgi:hypothetical protein